MIFDGKKFADDLEKDLIKSGKLAGKSLLILQCDGSDKESRYVSLKREAGERMGVNVKTQELENSRQLKEKLKLEEISDFGGVLVQLPIAGASREETEEILNLIPTEKDVDGLNPSSKFVPAAVLAVEKIMEEAMKAGAFEFDIYLRVGVVGAKGMVGKRLVKRLRDQGYVVAEFDIGDDLSGLADCDVVVGATGQAGLIKPEMLGEGVVAIDLGYPKGDFDPEVEKKAKFFTPVPGGAGPVTVVSLFENLAKTSP